MTEWKIQQKPEMFIYSQHFRRKATSLSCTQRHAAICLPAFPPRQKQARNTFWASCDPLKLSVCVSTGTTTQHPLLNKIFPPKWTTMRSFSCFSPKAGGKKSSCKNQLWQNPGRFSKHLTVCYDLGLSAELWCLIGCELQPRDHLKIRKVSRRLRCGFEGRFIFTVRVCGSGRVTHLRG